MLIGAVVLVARAELLDPVVETMAVVVWVDLADELVPGTGRAELAALLELEVELELERAGDDGLDP